MNVFAEVLIAVTVIVVAARLAGLAVARLGQPQVMGEIMAGILLGPSALGAVAPSAADWLFPEEVLPSLSTIANLGLIFFMFLVGLELDRDLMRGNTRTAGRIAALSLTLPLALGVAVGLLIHGTVAEEVDRLAFVLFVGAALAITAFPVLARILTERDMLRTPAGIISLTCAAIEDVCAWLVLAVVVAIVRSSGAADLALTLALTVVFVLGMVLLVRPALAWLVRRPRADERLGAPLLTVLLVGVLLSAYATEEIGIHAIFGAFMFGAVVPRDSGVVDEVTLKLEDFTVLLFLPVFFAITGLQTELAAIDSLAVAGIGLLVLAAAIAGKVVGAGLGARAGGMSLRDAAVIGILMNTRGLTELVILSVGKSLGVVPDAMFAILVMVALVTTLMTSPLLSLVARRPAPAFRPSGAGLAPGAGPRHILVALDGSPGDAALADLAGRLAEPTGARVTLARVLAPPERLSRRTTTIEVRDARGRADRRLAELADELRDIGVRVETSVGVESDVGLGICRLAERSAADLVLAGGNRAVLADDALGGPVGTLLEHCPADLAVYVDRAGAGVAFERGETVLVAFGGGRHELAAARLGERLAAASGVPLAVLARDDASAEALRAAGLDAARIIPAGQDPRAAMAEALPAAAVLVLGAGDRWTLERQSIGGSRARLVSGVLKPALIVRGGEGSAADPGLSGWLRDARGSRYTDWLGTRAGAVPDGGDAAGVSTEAGPGASRR